MYAYYKSVDEDGEPQWIIPNQKLMKSSHKAHVYMFKTEQIVDNCCDWFHNHRTYQTQRLGYLHM